MSVSTVQVQDTTTQKNLSNKAREVYARLVESRAARAALDKAIKEDTQYLLDWMGEASEAMSGKVRVFKVITTTRDNVSVRDLEKMFPEAYELLNKPTTYRQIR